LSTHNQPGVEDHEKLRMRLFEQPRILFDSIGVVLPVKELRKRFWSKRQETVRPSSDSMMGDHFNVLTWATVNLRPESDSRDQFIEGLNEKNWHKAFYALEALKGIDVPRSASVLFRRWHSHFTVWGFDPDDVLIHSF